LSQPTPADKKWIFVQQVATVVTAIMKTSQDLKLLATGVVQLLEKKGGKINAIKFVREKTDYGLKESKDFVDHVERYRERGKKWAIDAANDWCYTCATDIDECGCGSNNRDPELRKAFRELAEAIADDPIAWQRAVEQFYETYIASP
jgi:Ribosomal protein L7/L12 C-terminal domain